MPAALTPDDLFDSYPEPPTRKQPPHRKPAEGPTKVPIGNNATATFRALLKKVFTEAAAPYLDELDTIDSHSRYPTPRPVPDNQVGSSGSRRQINRLTSIACI